ncbi:DUF4304 domain-containing protein [Kitasatospora sp. RB6PN24]|uniref:DUF4304 domain-containing protein n=1 Tax=Kitasatospora humi TaxID=2893891 RepID=UPI001E4AE921|nr:DUF4304 domain-containing protein [Kitasatospora humi]MCC9311205.1 DUF4304 domain-containing protein [Kitasatospora humi]
MADPHAATAQELYRTMMRDRVAPRLRELGWKGSGQRFELPDPRAWVQLGFQSSRSNSASSLKFTINISVIDRQAWGAHQAEHPGLPAQPNPSTHYGPQFSPVRIGHLLAARQDTWWHISAAQPVDRVIRAANGVVASISDYAMPEIRHRLGHV